MYAIRSYYDAVLLENALERVGVSDVLALVPRGAEHRLVKGRNAFQSYRARMQEALSDLPDD